MSQAIVCEIRCPIHKFIGLTDWEKKIVDTPEFQRLRRIRQLALTDLVYPGAMHTRFEHSLGVMHVATLLFDSIVRNSRDVLYSAYCYDDHGLAKERVKIRLAALLHDVGHSPFSHASEDLYPTELIKREGKDDELKQFKHEDYSYALIENNLREAIENHPDNKNYEITAKDVTNLLANRAEAKHSLFWKDLLAHQLDADRMDYLLRDSHHLGVSYGSYDLPRLVSSVCAFENQGRDGINIGVLSGGFHAAESLIIARYSMFKQVYLHKSRMAFDIHLHHAFGEVLKGTFPLPTKEGLAEYLKWDDWRLLAALQNGEGGEHGARILNRNQYRQVYRSRDRVQDMEGHLGGERRQAEARKAALEKEGILVELKSSTNNWYKLKKGTDISVVTEGNRQIVKPLSEYSAIASLNTDDQYFLYVDKADVDRSKEIIGDLAAENVQMPIAFEEKKKSPLGMVDSKQVRDGADLKKQPAGAATPELSSQMTMLKTNIT